jgi:DDE superfamily endonuclease
MVRCGCEMARLSRSPLRRATLKVTCGCSKRLPKANPTGDLYLITDNLSSHKSPPIREWLENHPRVKQVFIPVGACWLNLQEAWWRVFRREALAGQSFADAGEIELATRVATKQLNHRSRPWVWGRSPRPPRHRRRTFVYRL